MSKAVGRWLKRLWSRVREGGDTREEQGQSLIVIILAFIGLLAFVGLAIDLGLVYVERIRVAQAADLPDVLACGDYGAATLAHPPLQETVAESVNPQHVFLNLRTQRE